jgi:hypothetical protein
MLFVEAPQTVEELQRDPGQSDSSPADRAAPPSGIRPCERRGQPSCSAYGTGARDIIDSGGGSVMPVARVRFLGAPLIAGLVIAGALGPGAGAARADDDTVTTVEAETFVPDLQPGDGGRLTEHQRENLRVTAPGHDGHPRATAGSVAGQAPEMGRSRISRAPVASALSEEGASAMSYGTTGVADDDFGVRATLGVVGSRSMIATRSGLVFYTNGYEYIDSTSLNGFFNLPGKEWWWGAAVVGSIKHGRFVVALPSFQGPSADCGRGYINLAVSKTSNPRGAWLRYRIPTPDAYAEEARIGLSDDKVAVTFNEWDLARSRPNCLGSAYEGSRIKVMDWADLKDGGALAVRDVSPTPRTSYWGWTPAVNTPTAGSTSAGTTMRLVGERKTTEWGNVAYATITGSAKRGTAALAGNVNLTDRRNLDGLYGPTESIAAMASGDGGLDETVTSVASRGSRFYFTAHTGCRLIEDPDFRTCARIVELDTSASPPAVVQDVWFVDLEQDTFLPHVGVARDGTVFLVMSRSSAVTPEPTDHFVVYRQPGELFSEGSLEVLFEEGTDRPVGSYGAEGSVVPDPSDPHRVIAVYPSETPYGSAARFTAFVGNLTGDPGGTASFGQGLGWVTAPSVSFTLGPDPTSPVLWVRWSGSPETTDTPGGPMLTHGVTSMSAPAAFADFSSPELGGTASDPFTTYVQWQTADGTWSEPLATELSIDTVPPSTPAPVRSFATGSVRTTLPFRLDWPALTDDESGPHRILVNRYDSFGNDDALQATLDGTATGTPLQVHAKSPTTLEVIAVDGAGNGVNAQVGPFTIREIEDRSSSVDYSSGWSRIGSSKSSDDTVMSATRAGKTASYSFSGSGVALVSTRGPKMGKAEVWVDGSLAATIDLKRDSNAYRQIVWHASWATAGSHTVVVKVLGTSGRPRVDVDEFLRF